MFIELKIVLPFVHIKIITKIKFFSICDVKEGIIKEGEMKEKIAKHIAHIAKKAAYKTVGKSFVIGSYEITPPNELINKNRRCKK